MHARSSRLSRLALVAGAVFATLGVSVVHASTPEEQAVLAPFQALLDGIGKRDHAMMRKPLLPNLLCTDRLQGTSICRV